MLEFLSFSLTDNIAIIIIIIMCFFSLFLLSKNKKLKDEIEDLKLGDRILADKYRKVDEENIISIDKISTDNVLSKDDLVKSSDSLNDSKVSLESSVLDSNDKVDEIVKKDKSVEKINSTNNKKDRVKDTNIAVDSNKHSKPYSKNILHDSPSITSPISLDVEKVSFNIDEFVKRDKSTSDYLENISNAISEEIKPQTIELTGYEKEQEENAIISYKELLKASKSSNSVNVSQEDTSEFIEELKKLRNSL